jgi:hypothetical protein
MQAAVRTNSEPGLEAISKQWVSLMDFEPAGVLSIQEWASIWQKMHEIRLELIAQRKTDEPPLMGILSEDY